MGKKLEARLEYYLDGQPFRGHVVLIRSGFEVHGMADVIAGELQFEWYVEGKTVEVQVNLETDEFRWPTEQELSGPQIFPVRRFS